MSDDYWNDDDQNNGDTGGRGLRAQLEKALADLKEVRTERDTLRSQVSTDKGVKFLEGKVKNAPAVVRLATKDGVDASDEKALEKWLTENGDLFVAAESSEQSQDDEQSSGHDQQDAPPAGLESAFGQMGRIHAAASPALVNKYAAVEAALPKDATEAQVLEAYRAAGL